MAAKVTPYLYMAALLLWVLPLGACGSDRSNFPSEGTAADPVNIGPAPATYSVTVSAGENSYYMAAGEQDNWIVAISLIDGEPDLFLYNDAAYSDPACQSENPDAEPDSCTRLCARDCVIYIRIAGSANSGASFLLSLAAVAPGSVARRLRRLVAREETAGPYRQ